MCVGSSPTPDIHLLFAFSFFTVLRSVVVKCFFGSVISFASFTCISSWYSFALIKPHHYTSSFLASFTQSQHSRQTAGTLINRVSFHITFCIPFAYQPASSAHMYSKGSNPPRTPVVTKKQSQKQKNIAFEEGMEVWGMCLEYFQFAKFAKACLPHGVSPC